MIFAQFVVVLSLAVINLSEINAHGMLMDPVNRGSAYRKGFNTPPNWDDSGNYCGGYAPRANENGGKYGTGTIVKTYTSGQEFVAEVRLTANHRGYFEFSLCPLNVSTDIETDDCFAKYPIKLADGSARYQLQTGSTGTFNVALVLPSGVICQHCSLRWHYRVANTWGICDNGRGGVGCGNQETFRTCSDITIVPA